jgi:rubrerythrin
MDKDAGHAVVRADDALRVALAAVWMVEGLVPKLLFLRSEELHALETAAPFLPFDPTSFLHGLGAFEIVLGFLLCFGLIVRPVLWIMLALLAVFSVDLLVLRPDLVLDPYDGLVKNLGLLGATGAALALRGTAFLPLLHLVQRLRWNLVNEIGTDVIYRRQARAARGVGVREALEDFAETEREHASAVRDALRRLGTRPSLLGGPAMVFSTALGWILARFGDRAMLRMDLWIERLAVKSYATSAQQFSAWGMDLLASEFRLMAAEEDDHARRIGGLLAARD